MSSASSSLSRPTSHLGSIVSLAFKGRSVYSVPDADITPYSGDARVTPVGGGADGGRGDLRRGC